MGIFTALENLFKWILWGIHDHLHVSWAISIILLTCAVRLVIMPITARQTRSMLAMQRLQPYIKQLQQKHKDDRAELNARMMEFYRDNQVNPLASCLPLLLQLPVFFALFRVLRHFANTADHPHHGDSNFSFLWGFVDDITKHVNHAGAGGWILLVIYITSQMFSSWVMATSPDPRQRKMMLVLPLVFVLFVVNFPVGLVLYWITTNLWTVGQYTLVVRFSNHDAKEVVLPEDSKGRKKVVVPKGAKAAAAAKAAQKGSDKPAKGVARPATTPTPPANARRNKRRR